ncbi:MAG: T9SS type A sorting domain-containing protein [Crocinitomicaceae bacterium]|nr:T9SS type A sorting domain-containing protein [Crocinitomicaceae bacterium]
MKIQLIAALAVTLVSNLHAQTFTNYTTADGLLSDNVNALDITSSDVVWFGTQNGVSVFDGVTWTDHTNAIDAGLVDDNITAVLTQTNGDVWVGTDFGACVYDGASWTTFTTAEGLGNNQIKCIEEDANGDVWFGTSNGASFYDGSWTNFGTPELPFGGVTAIEIMANGDVWLGSGLNGIIIYDGITFESITEAEGLIDDRIRSIRNTSSGKRWIGTSEGISVLNSSNVLETNYTIMYTMPAPDTLNPIEDLEIDNNGNIWIGVYVDYLVTEGGVVAFDGSTWTEYHVSDGLIGPVIRALDIDSENSVWVTTSTGVSKISDHSVSIMDLASNEEYVLFPNPATNKVTIRYPEGADESKAYIFNASMQLVEMLEFTAGAKEIQISTKHLSRGVYFVRTNEVTKKLILN